MTFLTCDYNRHKEIYTADGKEVDYSTFCDLRAKNAIEANQTALILREKDGGLCTPAKAYDYERFLSYNFFFFISYH
ncbi:hypothetical protein NYG93_08830 [Campylobacter felis]|uniref:hypothetical protein n=1 Tax=Campylobacter felis TaxID=2974565 RepID=UPI0025670A2F|nr:hypothetical protein [Campylobacter felis]